MKLLFAVIIWIAISTGVTRAQEPVQQPIVETELDKSEVVPGQYATLRVTVLVPTWLPKPLEFPTLETPNLRVRLPERSTGPTSRTIEGTEWSGVSRRYMISPMVAGTFDIPAQKIPVTYAVPGGSDTAQAELQTAPVTIKGIVPQGAEDLDPFIAADSLTLTQEISQPMTGLVPGQSIKRTVIAEMEGASPIVLPKLIPEFQLDGIAVYPDQPAIGEEEDRGILSGTRTETETLMAEGGAAGKVPGIELRWFNLKSGVIETAKVDGFDISVDGPSAAAPNRERSTLALAAIGLAALVTLLLLIFLFRRLWPRATMAYRSHRERRLASKAWAERVLWKAVQNQNYPAALRALDEWASRPPLTDTARIAPVHEALTAIGKSIYGRDGHAPRSDDWLAVSDAVKETLVPSPRNDEKGLPPLNPDTARRNLR